MEYDEEQENYFRRMRNGTWDAYHAEEVRVEKMNAERIEAKRAADTEARRLLLGDNFHAHFAAISAASKAKVVARDAAFEANPAYVKRRDEIVAIQNANKAKKREPIKPGSLLVSGDLTAPKQAPAEIIAKYSTSDIEPVYPKLHTASAATFRSKLYKNEQAKQIAERNTK